VIAAGAETEDASAPRSAAVAAAVAVAVVVAVIRSCYRLDRFVEAGNSEMCPTGNVCVRRN